MSQATVKTRNFSEEELKKLNYNTLKVRGHGLIENVYLEEKSDGKCVATYALFGIGSKSEENARRIGGKILQLFDFVDEVWHDGKCVAERK